MGGEEVRGERADWGLPSAPHCPPRFATGGAAGAPFAPCGCAARGIYDSAGVQVLPEGDAMRERPLGRSQRHTVRVLVGNEEFAEEEGEDEYSGKDGEPDKP